MKRLSRFWALTLVLGVTAVGCSDHEFHPPSEEEREAQADSVYSAAIFDTLTWASDSARIQTGNLVFADECRRCHGPLGRGETDYARDNELEVPSLVSEGWALEGQIDTIRHRIFVGHGPGMPNWGMGRLTPRQIDAAAFYILEQLRPEVLSDTTAPTGPLD